VAFLRVKKTSGRVYAYLVESHWDPETGHPRQRVIAYLGRLDRARSDSIPEKFRTPALLRSLEARVAAEYSRRRASAAGRVERFVDLLLQGDRPGARRLVRQSLRDLGPEGFSTEVLAPALHEVGRRFERRVISISAEHLATGIAAAVLAETNARLPEAPKGSPEVVLCVPEGETHTLSLQVAEGLLRRKGYHALNVGGSAPASSICDFVRARRPVGVLISVTLTDRLEPGWRLARQLLREVPGARVAIGGQGTAALRPGTQIAGLEVVLGPVEEYLSAWPDALVARPSEGSAPGPSHRPP
jgi:methanogenic corrinoid protein MtbC1